MAIRPVDLQGAFVGAQANATVLRNAEEAPAIAQAVLQATGRRLDVMPFPDAVFRT